jgi:hypothetical protein
MSDEKTLGRKKGYKKSTVEKGGHVIGESTDLTKNGERNGSTDFNNSYPILSLSK